MKTIRNVVFGALIAGSVGAALAAVGTPPGTGPSLIDGGWLNGLAAGQNYSYQSGLTAAGSTQATALQLVAGSRLVEVDTTGSGTGVALPVCVAGTAISLYNNGANTLAVYPSIANNGATAAQDTINNTTSVTVATHVAEVFFCAKTGVWAAK